MLFHHKVNHIVDSLLTQGEATKNLTMPVIITWYTNRTNIQSVVHSHPYYELILPLNGEVIYSVNGGLVHLKEGELIILPADIYHYGKYDISSDISERLLAQIDRDFWDDIAQESPFRELYKMETPIVIDANSVISWEIRAFFEQMDLMQNVKNHQLNNMINENMIRTLFVYFTESLHNQHSQQFTKSPLVEQAILYIQDRFTDPALTVYDIADHTYTSREHLSRIFKRYTMESIHSYITELRMQHFHQQLSLGKSIIESCIDSGFSDYSSFTRSFKRIHGMSPSQYIKNMNKI